MATPQNRGPSDARAANHFVLIALDMDMTLVPVETIDELARLHGCHREVSRITAQAMAGRVPFQKALVRRAALLKGMEVRQVERFAARLSPRAGAAAAVREFHRRGLTVALVTGGFHRVADPLARRLGIDRVVANFLEARGGRLTGRVHGPVQSPRAKADALRRLARALGAGPDRAIAVGDGANDASMLRAAGFSIVLGRNPRLGSVADARIPDRSLRRLADRVGEVCERGPA